VRHLVFSHPNNPTGAVFSPQVIAQIARLANAYDVTVLVDELYARLLHDDRRFPHLAAEPGMFPRTVTLLGPSKTESLSGYRLGVVVAAPEIIGRIENVQSIMALRAPAYAQHVLIPWLRDDRNWLADRLKEFTALRTLTVESLRRLPWLKLQPQAGTAYAWPDVSALGLAAPVVAEALLCDAGVLVSPGYQFGPASGGHFRVCYARDETEWTQALDRMVDVLDGLALRNVRRA
jgi:aspartate/methionine/tyrosine aminotransferase